MFKKILVAYDDSETAKSALTTAVDMAEGSDISQITVLKVIDWQNYNVETFKIATSLDDKTDGDTDINVINEITNIAESKEIATLQDEIKAVIGDVRNVDVAVIAGTPAETIVSFTEDNGFDCIVMGHRGRGMIRGMLGSVAFSVLQKASVPVLIVR